MNDCLFCKIVAGEVPAHKVYEDDDFLAFLDINPVNLGHTLVISKTHAENIFELSAEALAGFGERLQKVGLAVKNGAGADGLNVIMNNGAAAGQVIPHAHFHLIPRFKDDGFEHWHGREHSQEEFEQIRGEIAEKMTQ